MDSGFAVLGAKIDGVACKKGIWKEYDIVWQRGTNKNKRRDKEKRNEEKKEK